MMELKNGRPATKEGRPDKEIRVYDLLDSLHVTYERLDHEPAMNTEEFLDITPGSVSVMGLMNDVNHRVQLVIDADVLKSEYFGCHPCINTSSLKIRTEDLLGKIIPAMGHEPVIVELGE